MRYTFLCFLLVITFLNAFQTYAQKKVLVMQIRSEIDPRMSRYVELALKQANEINADYIIVDMNTFGGAVDDADKIRTAFLECKKPVYSFINKNAASAGALISIACDSIYMQTGSSIGAATVVNGSDGSVAPDKYQSYMRSLMRSTAEHNHRNPKIAEAMVDPDVQLDSAIKKIGKVLTFTTSEAIKNGFCEAQVKSIDDILVRNKLEGAEIVKYELSNSERIISFFLNPAISGILILIMIGGIYFELQTPGIGFPLIAALIAAALYFTPYYLNGLAENWEILMFFIGIILLGVEIFVIPGFGIVGISGLILIFSSLILSMLNNDFLNFEYVSTSDLSYSMLSVLISFIVTVVLIFYSSSKIVNSDYFKKISLGHTSIAPINQFEVNVLTNLVGNEGVVFTPLKPGGKVKINSEVYDAVSEGGFLDTNVTVKVIEVISSVLKVRQT
jgi:membrane-bound serine protease (ClpP class)